MDTSAITEKADGTTASTAGSLPSMADTVQSRTSRLEDCRVPIPTRFAFQLDSALSVDQVNHVGLRLPAAIAVDIVSSANAPSTGYDGTMLGQRPEPVVPARRTDSNRIVVGTEDRCGARSAEERLETLLFEVFKVP